MLLAFHLLSRYAEPKEALMLAAGLAGAATLHWGLGRFPFILRIGLAGAALPVLVGLALGQIVSMVILALLWIAILELRGFLGTVWVQAGLATLCLFLGLWWSGTVSVFPYEKLNVILITVDCLRPDHLEAYGYPRPTSPRLNTWARNGVVFKEAIAQGSWTMPGLLSLLTGLNPPAHGVELRGETLLPRIPTLPKILQRYRYATPNLTYLTSEPSFANLGYPPASASLVFSEHENPVAGYVLAHPREKFFIWYHYRFIHLPYMPIPDYEKLFAPETPPTRAQEKRLSAVRKHVLFPSGQNPLLPEDRTLLLSLYDARVRRFDDFFGEIAASLERTGLWNRTVLVLTADHGEELLDHGWIGHASSGHEARVYDELLHIPLILIPPRGLIRPGIFQPMVRQIDILPTLLDLLKIPEPKHLQGRSLLPFLKHPGRFREEPAFSETAIQGYRTRAEEAPFRIMSFRTSRWKLVKHLKPDGIRFRLYDLEADPRELHDRSSDEPERVNALHLAMLEVASRSMALHARFDRLEARGPVWKEASRMPAPRIVSPVQDEHLDFGRQRGAIELRWDGKSDLDYEIEYHIGKGIYLMAGTVVISGNAHRFGPFPREQWESLRLWNPWTFRVRVKGGASPWSSWSRFTL